MSPHLDDAVLSCSGLLTVLSKKTEVTVITLFTHVSYPNTFSAKRFLQKCQTTDLQQLFKDRRYEDVVTVTSLGVKAHHLGYEDGTWRKLNKVSIFREKVGLFIPEVLHRYPTFLRIKRGKMHREDQELILEIRDKLKSIVGNNVVFFAPLAIGGHIDHIITREVASLFPNTIFWSDFPYNLTAKPDDSFLKQKGLKRFIFKTQQSVRERAIKGYLSQLSLLFPDKTIPAVDEVYFVEQK